MSFSFPQEYGYVLLSMASTAFLNQYHSFEVGKNRGPAKVLYPNAYATPNEAASSPEKYRFNCAQRAHQNYLENLPNFLVSSAIAGTRYPVVTAALGAAWVVGRLAYVRGYIYSSRNEGQGRYYGAFYIVAQLGLMGLAAWTGWNVAVGN